MKIAISSELRLLPILRGAVKSQASENGFSDADSDCLALAIEEAASHVACQAYAGQPANMLSVEIVAYPDRLEFVLEGLAPKAGPELAEPHSPDEIRPGGSGTRFNSTDFSCYDACHREGNRLRLVKFLPAKNPEKK
ncbi:MAG TPA: hypothetical protein VMW54_14345 [Terriglobia bacterium]|nr:hypothetical protein [Terriglobia bacterium]